MNFLKRSVFVLLIFMVLSIVISMFFPSSLTIKKEIFFEADTKIVTQQLIDFSFDDNLSGFVVKKENITYNISDKATGVLVSFNIDLNFGLNPITKFKGLFAKKDIELILDEHLNALKLKIEDMPKIHKVVVEKTHRTSPMWFLSIRDTINQTNTSNIHGKLIEEVQQYLLTNNLQDTASPVVIYHYWSDSIIDIEAGIPITEKAIVTSQRIKLNKIDTGYYVSATHFGAYERLPETYFGINEWMRKNEVTVIGPPFEFYITDPASTDKQEEWETLISFPIK